MADPAAGPRRRYSCRSCRRRRRGRPWRSRGRTAPVVAPAEDAAVQDAGGGVAATPDAAAAREGGAAFDVEQLLDRVATEGDDDEKWAALSASFDAVRRRADAGSGPGTAAARHHRPGARRRGAARRRRPCPPGALSLRFAVGAIGGHRERRDWGSFAAPRMRGGVGVGVPRPGSGGARPRPAAPRVGAAAGRCIPPPRAAGASRRRSTAATLCPASSTARARRSGTCRSCG